MTENKTVPLDFSALRAMLSKKSDEATRSAKREHMPPPIKIGNSIELRITNRELREALRAKFEKR